MKTESDNLAKSLAACVLKTGAATLEPQVIAKVRQHLLDGVASAFIGCRSQIFRDLVQCDLPENGTLPGREALAQAWAFAVNGSVSEDGSREGACHPAAAVVPAVMAFGADRSLKEIERAMVAGYDVMIRIARAGNPLFARKGFHGTAVTAPFGAAAAISLLNGYDLEITANALRIAALGGSGLMAAFKCGTTQPLQVGWGVRNGAAAAVLAGKGHAGYAQVMEEGFIPAYLEKGFHESVMAPLEKGSAIESCYLKPYPGCRHMHASLEAFSTLMEQHNISHQDIRQIRVGTYRVALDTGIRTLTSRGDAYFNIPYAIAARAVLGAAVYDSFDECHFAHPDIQRIISLTSETVDPEIEALYPGQRGSRVEVELNDGRTFSHRVSYPLGEPESPLAMNVTVDKFISCTSGFLSQSEREVAVRQLTAGGERFESREFFRMLSLRLFFGQ